MKLRITVLPGDGIGPEVTREAMRVLRAIAEVQGYDFTFDEKPMGGVAIRQLGTPLPKTTLDACLKSDAVLLGAVGAPEFEMLPPENRPEAGLLALRRALGGFANLRPVVCYPAIVDCSPLRPEVVRGADILFVRELLGGIYFGEPRGCDAAGAYNTMRYSEQEIERVARIAFDLARKRRKKLTSVDKANVLETSQLWRKTVARLGRQYPDVSLDHCYVDSCAMRLVSSPTSFDVVLTENLFGDILSDEAAVIAGSLGMLASASIGGAVGIYEPVHGSAPDIAGRGIANPLGAIASAAMLLRHSAGLPEDAAAIEYAIEGVLNAGYRTPDLRRNGSKFNIKTADMGKVVEHSVVQELERQHAYHAV